MRARTLIAMVFVLAMTVVVAAPASAKAIIGEVTISGPGLGGGSGSLGGGGGSVMRLEEPAAAGMWESGLLDDRKQDSVSDLGVAVGELGPQYRLTYRFDFGPGNPEQVVRQVLYPYAEGGPVTYTPPGQRQTGAEDLTGMGFDMPIPGGWFRPNSGFFQYLVEHGFPATNPLAVAPEAAPIDPVPDAPPTGQAVPWGWILIGVAGIAAASLISPTLRRRVLMAVTRVNH
jgi:hypothetical protein